MPQFPNQRVSDNEFSLVVEAPWVKGFERLEDLRHFRQRNTNISSKSTRIESLTAILLRHSDVFFRKPLAEHRTVHGEHNHMTDL